jgi:hypothetical protein
MYKHKHRPLLLLLTASALIVTAGCGKKQAKNDLSSTHTTETAAVSETMAETAAAAETTAAEIVISTDSGSTGSKNNGVPMNTYKNNSVSIEYPTVSNIEDTALAAQINETLKTHALSVLAAYEIDETSDTVDITCKSIAADRNRFSVIYSGYLSPKGAAHPVNVFYSDTIDLKTGKSLSLKDYADPYTMAGYVLSDDCYFVSADGTLSADEQSQLMEIRDLLTIDEYTDIFENADFASMTGTDSAFPQCFSYEDGGSVIFSIPVPHAAGDYALVSFTPENK